MQAKYILRLIFLLLLPLLGLRGEDYVVVANKGTEVKQLPKQEMKEILLGIRSNWADGTLVRLVVQGEGAVHEHVLKDFMRMTPYQYDRYWKRLVFSGNGVMPETLRNDQEVLAYVSRTPGAIGYVSSSTSLSQVKVVPILD